MKLTFLAIMAIFSQFALAHGDMLEPVLITGIQVSGDRMPTTPEGARDRKDLTEITFQAMSGGCTDASSFQLIIVQNSGQNVINLLRIKPDICEAVQRPVTLKLQTTEADGNKTFTLHNSLLTTTAFAF